MFRYFNLGRGIRVSNDNIEKMVSLLKSADEVSVKIKKKPGSSKRGLNSGFFIVVLMVVRAIVGEKFICDKYN